MKRFLHLLAILSSACSGPIAADAGMDSEFGWKDVGAERDTPPMEDDTPDRDTPPPVDAPASGCTRNTECVIRPESCCGSCGAALPGDFVGLHMDDVASHTTRACIGNPGCPECARPDDPFLVASCASGICVGVDLHQDVRTECTGPSDCVLGPRQCCACGLLPVAEILAYNPARGSPYDLICNPDDPACPPCVPDFGSAAPGCVDGHCVVFGPD